MFGFGFASKVKKVLLNHFNYKPNYIQEPVLKKIVKEAKVQGLNEYDAAMMFMLVQMNSLMGEGEDVKTFVRVQCKNVESVISLGYSRYSDILILLEEVKSSHSIRD